MASVTDGYTQLSSGYWEKLSDGSSPYLFDGEKMVFMGDGSSGGGSVDVLGTIVDEFQPQDNEINNGDNVKTCLEKLQGQVRTHRVETEEEVRNSTLDGFVAIDSPITSGDNVLGAFGKAQGQIDSLNGKIGEVNGVAPLDADKKIPVEHLPTSVFRFMGHYDASTNTPELKNDDASLQGGEVYQCSVAGSLNGISLEVGDLVVYEFASQQWVKSLASGEVISVNNKTGNVVINGANITVSDSDKRTLQEALSTESSRVSVLTPLNTDKASGYIEFAGIRWGYERTNLTGGRQFFQSVTGTVDISYTQKAFFDAGIEVNRSVSAKATTTKNYYDPLSLSDLRELAVIHVFVNNQLWNVNQLVIGTSVQMLAMWAERVV